MPIIKVCGRVLKRRHLLYRRFADVALTVLMLLFVTVADQPLDTTLALLQTAAAQSEEESEVSDAGYCARIDAP